MSKNNEIELAKIKANAQGVESIISFLKHFATLLFGYLSVKAIFEGLTPFLSAKPDVITAITGFIEKLNFYNITAYGLAIVTTSAWTIERSGRKKAKKELQDLQDIQEQRKSADIEPETDEFSDFDNLQNE